MAAGQPSHPQAARSSAPGVQAQERLRRRCASAPRLLTLAPRCGTWHLPRGPAGSEDDAHDQVANQKPAHKPGSCQARPSQVRVRSQPLHRVLKRYRDSCSHEVTCVIKRKTNRRHMIGDHHGRTAERATFLVRAVDAILGTRESTRQVCLEAGLLLPAGSLAVRCSSGARPRPALPAARRRAWRAAAMSGRPAIVRC